MFSFKQSSPNQQKDCLLKDVGVAEFNQQHLRLASYAVEFGQIVEELAKRDVTNEDWKHIDALFSRVSLFVSTHFKEEEEWMQSEGYPEFVKHKKLHDNFVQELAKMQSQINNRNLKFKGKLNTLLWDWLYKHINEVDYQYREYFAQKEGR